MRKWEYFTVSIPYDKKYKNWALDYPEKQPLVGLTAILEAYGAMGWELVSLHPEHFQAFPGMGKWVLEPEIYRATFKRPLE